MPAQQGSDEVCRTEQVEGARERETGESGQAGCIPRYLRSVDGEVGGDGAVAALGDEDGVGFIFRDGRCGCKAVLGVVDCGNG